MKTFLFALAMLMGLNVSAQENPGTQTKTLFGSKSNAQWGFMLSPGLQTASIYSEQATFGQLRAGLVLNDSWTFGVLGAASLYEVYPVTVQDNFAPAVDMSFYNYGAFAEYRLKPHNLIHLSFPLSFGISETDLDERDWSGDDFFYDDLGDDYRLFIEPGVNAELNLHKYARVYAGLSYRFHGNNLVSNSLVPELEDYMLINAGVKVGIFNISRNK